MLLISIDGATRRNGKPDCVAAGGVFVQRFNEKGERMLCEALSVYEYGSTNQRGELLALLKALDYIHAAETHANVVTDSEYIFNAMTKMWYTNWQRKGWKTAADEPVKNRDIWLEVCSAMQRINERDIEISFYHIKGHCIPFGKVTATNALKMDPSGALLYGMVVSRYKELRPTKQDVLAAANDLSLKNNGFRFDEATMESFVVANVVVDAIATKVVDAADQQS